ncbi:LTA synthase family protein [Limosilactobacillus fastidiosus]|uniref:LTA synthase family protein n=1 Tax=Limosilactobacillus fastidiosus TaxID=2759855 RepID=A0ABR6E6T5_9LACO|nr:LTA synthase family protein [Limosilactobacillus fastidiosus]MBB1062616.1 LTA synthase family protein [Limosilactobacillus fastidiosus]MCD7083984.1 LTA synthase family protein [Limosilactobacillus fastidiosus]
MKKIRSNTLLFLVLLWTGFSQIYWQLGPHIADYNNQSLHTSAYLIVKGFTVLGPDILMLILGYYISKRQHKESFIIKVWLNTLGLGVLVSTIVAMSSNQLAKVTIFGSNFLDSLFPIIRNSYPLIFGSLLGLLLVTLTKQLDLFWQRRITIGTWTLIAIPFFNYPNNWGWSGNFLVIFYALVFVLGSQINLASKPLVGYGLIALVINVLLQGLMPTFSISGGTIERYSEPTNVLNVFVAYVIGSLMIRSVKHFNWRMLFSFLVLIESSGLIARLLLPLKIGNQCSSFKVAIYTVVALVVAMVIAELWSLITCLTVFRNINQLINHFTASDMNNQFLIIKDGLKKRLPNIFLFGLSYIIAACSMLLMNNGFTVSPNVDATYNIFAYTFGTRELLILFTTFLIFLTAKFIQALTKRYWVSLMLIVLINAIIVVANREKIAARNEPILPSDLLMVSVAKELFGMVSSSVWTIAVAVLILLIILTIWLEKKYPVKEKWGVKKRVLFIFLAPLLFATSLFWNHQGTPLSNFMHSIDDQSMFYNQLSGARINGPVIQFMNNIDVTVMEKPAGYSEKAMNNLVRKYHLRANEINQTRINDLSKQSIIFNLSESFANPQRVPGVKLKNNPVPYITKMMKDNTGGIMISSGFGGGTANMEYMTLTGFSLSNFSPTLPTPYTQLVTNLKKNPSIVEQFKSAVAIHPYNGVFYNRISVYEKFGFDKFLYLGSKYPIRHQKKIDRNPYLSDETSYRNVLDQLNKKQGGQFINLVTMQNHFPYDQNYYNEIQRYNAIRVSDGTNIGSVNDFSTGIHYTDKAVEQFIKKIDQIQKPITIVFYGDHLPGIYQNSMAKDGVKLHETDYFIYSNLYARQHGAKNFYTDTKYVSPNDFIAMVAKQTNAKVNWYQALLTDVYEKLPAMGVGLQSSSNVNSYNNSTQFVNQDGKLVSENQLSKKQKQLLYDYRLVQYDVTAGKHYVSNQMK